MRVLLISANTEVINMPTFPFGLACVAQAARERGHEVELIDLMAQPAAAAVIEDSIHRLAPQAIGISVRNIDDQRMENPRFLLQQVREVVAVCREHSSAPIILGGAGYSIFPESALEYLGADMGIQGEGEIAFNKLLEPLEHGDPLSGVPGLYVRGKGFQGEREFVAQLDSLPLPGPELLSPSYVEHPDFWLPFQTRRGCSMDCSYCSTATIEGRMLRKRSPEKVVEGVVRFADAGIRRFYFTDNTFNLPPSYARELCRALISRAPDISWRCIVYPVRLDQELVELMARAGCKEVSIGFESGSERVLSSMNKRFGPADVRHTCELLGNYGMRRMGFLLLGGPGETKKSALESLSFADSLGLEAVKVTVGVRIYPHTHLARIAVEDGLISPNDDLLSPRFYLVPGLEDWLRETVKDWINERPNWTT